MCGMVSGDFEDSACMKVLVSKALGYLIILGSVGVNVPQILSILRAKSAEGISMSMFLLKLIGYTITLSYNLVQGNPFSTWGENLFLLIQTFAIVLLMFRFSSGIDFKVSSATVVWLAALAAMCLGQVPKDIMVMLQSASVVVFVASTVPQVISNFRTGSTGKLAFLTFVLNFAGSAARVFTTLQEVPDKIILTSAILGAILNATIALQILIYGDKSSKKATATTPSKKAKKD